MSKMPDKIDPEKGAGILALQDLKYQEDDPDCMYWSCDCMYWSCDYM